MPDFPTIIPTAERVGAEARRFLAHAQSTISSLYPQPPPDAAPPLLPVDAAPAAPAMPEAPPPLGAPAPPPPPAPPDGGFQPMAPAMPQGGGFDPGAQAPPPPPDPAAQADQFAQYVSSHPAMQEASQDAQQGPPMPTPPDGGMPPAPTTGGFAAAGDGSSPTDDAQRFADYTRTTAGVDPSARRLGPDQVAPTDLSRIGIDVPVPGPSEVRSAAIQGANVVGQGIDTAGDTLWNQITGFGTDQQEFQDLSRAQFDAARRGQRLPPEQDQRLADLSSQYGLALTGEPLANAGGGGIGPALVAHLRSAGLTEDAARLLMDQVAAYPEMPPALYARVERLTAGLPEEAANVVWAGLDRYRLEQRFGADVGRGGVQPPVSAAESTPPSHPPIAPPERIPTAESLSPPAEARPGGPPIEPPSAGATMPLGGRPPAAPPPPPPRPPSSAAQAAEIARLQLDKLPEGVRDVVQGAAQDGNFWRTQRRGVIPDAQAEQMADDLGRSVDQMIASGKAGKAYNTETTRAIRNGVVAQAMKVNEIATQIAQDPTSAGPGLIAQQVAEGMKLADLTRVAEGARAEAGRTLRAYQAFARDYAADPTNAVQRIFKSNNLTAEQATLKVNEFQKMLADGANPFQMANFWANVERPPPNIGDWFSLLRYNSMLSGPRTLEVNTLGNVAEVPWRLIRDTGASVAKGRLEEMGPELAGTWQGFKQGIRAFGETLANGITAEQAGRGEVPRSVSARTTNPVGKVVATGLEAPMRAMGATDEMFRQIAYGMAMGRQAALKASSEGLTGRAFRDRADELFRNPSAGMMTAAGSIADRMTYHGQMGPLGRALEVLQHVPVAGPVALPFVRTVVHITNRGLDLTPIGAARTGIDLLRGGYKNGQIPAGMAPLGERVPDNIAGSAAFALLGLAAGQGLISGPGPQDPAQRDTLRATGWRPYSVKIGDHWVSYQAWGPFAIPLAMAAALPEAERYAGAKDTNAQVAMDTAHRAAALLADQGMLAGVGAIYKGWTQPDRYGSQWVEQVLQSGVPYGGLANTIGQATDPLERRPNRGDLLGAVETRLPGIRQSLPPAQDALGRPAENEAYGLSSLIPSRVAAERPDPVVGALLDAGVAIPEPPPSVLGVPLSEDDKRVYREATGRELQRSVQPFVTSPTWDRMSPENRAANLRAYITAARKVGADAAYTSATKRGGVKPTPAPPRPLR